MKHILVYILLITNLCSGVAFAWDTHPEAMAGHGSVIVDLVADDHDHPDEDLHHGDHCCHGAAHLMGIFSDVTTPVVVVDRDHFFALPLASPSLYITPLIRPPIV